MNKGTKNTLIIVPAPAEGELFCFLSQKLWQLLLIIFSKVNNRLFWKEHMSASPFSSRMRGARLDTGQKLVMFWCEGAGDGQHELRFHMRGSWLGTMRWDGWDMGSAGVGRWVGGRESARLRASAADLNKSTFCFGPPRAAALFLLYYFNSRPREEKITTTVISTFVSHYAHSAERQQISFPLIFLLLFPLHPHPHKKASGNAVCRSKKPNVCLCICVWTTAALAPCYTSLK